MEIEVREGPLELDLYGVSGAVPNFDFAGTGKALMDEMWKRIKAEDLRSTGINYWVYFTSSQMLTAVELEGSPPETSLEHRPVTIRRFAYYKHVGPYEQLHEVHQGMEKELTTRGLKEIGPRVEKYGHWTEDTSKLATEVFIAIE
jgi:hypothetical protein